MAVQQELYLDLLRLGKTEREIDAVDEMPSWPTRYLWLADKKFSTRRLEAQAQGVELALVSHEERCLHVYPAIPARLQLRIGCDWHAIALRLQS